MYYYIKGKLALKDLNFAVVEAGGVGYLIYTSIKSLSELGETGSAVTMYTHLNVREDAQDLFGFTTVEEKNMFLHLLSVSGVGPKAALAILSVVTPAQFAVAVVTNDVKTITKASGVGPKLAQRVILELKDKMKNEDLELTAEETAEISSSDSMSEAVSALVVLGYSTNDAKAAVKKADPSLSTEEIIKKALASLM